MWFSIWARWKWKRLGRIACVSEARAARCTGQLEARGRRAALILREVIPQRADAPADENKNRPHPRTVADGVNEHPDLKRRQREHEWMREQIRPIKIAAEQRGEHGVEIRR